VGVDLRGRAAAALALLWLLLLLLLLLLLPLLSGLSDGGLARVEGVDEGEQLLGLETDLEAEAGEEGGEGREEEGGEGREDESEETGWAGMRETERRVSKGESRAGVGSPPPAAVAAAAAEHRESSEPRPC
jgi:hypothetical protein